MPYVFHSRVNKDGTQSLRYQVNYLGKKWVVPTGYQCKKSNFKNGRIKGASAEVNENLRNLESEIDKAIEKALAARPQWSVQSLKGFIKNIASGAVVENSMGRMRIVDYWVERIKYYESEGPKKKKQYHYAKKHANSLKVLFGYEYYPLKNNIDRPGYTDRNKNLQFGYLDQEMFLDELTSGDITRVIEELLVSRSSSSVNGYLGNLRTIIDRAMIVRPKIILENPFTGVKLPPMVAKDETPLELEEMIALAKAQHRFKRQLFYRDLFFWSYYTAGMRAHDICILPKSAIKNNRLTYYSNKTGEYFDFILTQELIDIINRNPSKTPYLFDLIDPKLTGDELEEAISSKTKAIRKSLTYLARVAGINRPIGLHIARHTFNHLNKHMPIHLRQRGLGHKTLKTTEAYGKKKEPIDHIVKDITRIGQPH